VCPSTDGYKFDDFAKQYSDFKEIDTGGFIMEPNTFVLGWTEEQVFLPSHARLAARVEGKSSLARLGIGIHITAPTIHAGFNGKIQLEICNHGSLRVKLTTGMPVCQLIFEQTLGTPSKGYAGQFIGQTAK
jgi:dCTP deaminase